MDKLAKEIAASKGIDLCSCPEGLWWGHTAYLHGEDINDITVNIYRGTKRVDSHRYFSVPYEHARTVAENHLKEYEAAHG